MSERSGARLNRRWDGRWKLVPGIIAADIKGSNSDIVRTRTECTMT